MGVWKLSLPCSLCLVCLVFPGGRGDFPLSQRLVTPEPLLEVLTAACSNSSSL